jgi:hypothetical protein
VKHRIKLSNLQGNTGGIVELDGVNIAASVYALQFNAGAKVKPQLVLDLLVDKGSKIEGEGVEVSIPDATARVLRLLGWTPPADDDEFDHEPGDCPTRVDVSTVEDAAAGRRVFVHGRHDVHAGPCNNEYIRPGGRQPGDRIVKCRLDAGHAGPHVDEAESTWSTREEGS